MKRLVALAPVNALAARVVSSGTHFDPIIKPHTIAHFDVMPAVKKWEGLGITDTDLTGRTFGRFKVMGYSATHKARWVVRCSCGAFELRTSKGIRNPNNNRDMCIVCRSTFYITHGHSADDTRTKEQRIAGEKQIRGGE
jgi:hypothetical protein